MPTLTIEYTTDSERLQLERAIAYIQEMLRLGQTAAPGTVLDTCERFALDQGRQLLRDQLQAAIQTRADAEKKSPAPAPKARRRGRSSPPSGRSG
jgi:hypothetical protein